MKKIICMVLAVVLSIGVLSGCKKEEQINTPYEYEGVNLGNTGGLSLPLDDSYTEIKVLVPTTVSDLNDKFIIGELRKITGLNVQIQTATAASITEKLKTLIASKTLMPDIAIYSGITSSMNADLALQGAFEPVNTHLDELPNLKEYYYDNPEKYGYAGITDYYSISDGNLYIFPYYNNSRNVNHGMMYRKDIFDKHNISTWNSTEEFYDVLKQLKELYPNSIPFVTKNGIKILEDLGASWGLNKFGMFYDEDTEKWSFSPTDDKFYDMLCFVKKLYDEKLLDSEFLTRTQADWTSLMTAENKAFVTWDWIDRMNMFKEQTAETVPDYNLRYAYPVGPTGKVITISPLMGGANVAKNDHSVLSLKLLDYLISESGAQLMSLGIEGKTFEFAEDGTVKYLGFEEQEETPAYSNLEEKYGMFAQVITPRYDRRSAYYALTEYTQEAQDIMYEKKGGGFLPLDPIFSLTDEENEVYNKYITELDTKAREFATKFILNDIEPEKAWNEWLAQAEKMGYKEIEKVYNQAQKRYDSK